MTALVEDNPARHRFEILVDGSLAGFATYRPGPDAITFVHTEIAAEYRDMRLGGTLAKGALDQVRERGGRVVAVCPFIAGYIERHPEYQDLLATS